MRQIGLGFAYLCIYTTPIQIGIIIWQLIIIFTSDYTFLSMSTKEFLVDNLKFLHDWVYSWFWNALLDFLYQFSLGSPEIPEAMTCISICLAKSSCIKLASIIPP